MGAKLTKIYETATKTIKMMQNIFMARTADKSFLKKISCFSPFVSTYFLYLHILFVCTKDGKRGDKRHLL